MNSTEVDSLEREHRNISGVEHPNVVKILRFERGDGFARLFLEWCPGGSLTDRIHKSQIAGRTEPEKIGEALLRNYTRQIVSGLKFLHDKGILHRDIKPGNILIHYDGSLKLTDFGLSRHTETINPKTKACGTVRYMSPESIGGSFSVFSDIWAVGATVTEMASGELPWSQLDQSLQQDYLLVGYIFRNRGSTLNHPSIPTALSVEAKDFLNTCFQQEPHLRGTCDALLKHPFLAPRIGTPA
jgi:serine/threonine protein kinase